MPSVSRTWNRVRNLLAVGILFGSLCECVNEQGFHMLFVILTDRLGATQTEVRNSSKSTTPSRLASQRRKTLAARRAGLRALGKERLYRE